LPTLRINYEELDAELVLFDLDGTLVDDRARYRRLAESRMKAMTRNVSKEAAETWARLEGVDPESLQVDMNGPLSKAPRREDLTVAAVALYLHGHPWHRARELSKAIYDEADEIQRRTYTPRFFPGAREALEGLRSRGFRLGVARPRHDTQGVRARRGFAGEDRLRRRPAHLRAGGEERGGRIQRGCRRP